jgi:hypothetical protein
MVDTLVPAVGLCGLSALLFILARQYRWIHWILLMTRCETAIITLMITTVNKQNELIV